MSSIVAYLSKAERISRTVEPSFLIFWIARSIARYSISDGTSLKPIVSSMIAISPTKIRLTRLRPRCRAGADPRLPKAADSSHIAEVHPDEEGPTHDVAIWHGAPERAG